MRKYIALVSLFVLVFSLSGCSKVETTVTNSNLTQPEQTSEISIQNNIAVPTIGIPEQEFSYKEDLKEYKENDPGVYYDGFSNTSSLELISTEEAIERAKVECTIEYNTTTVYYDSVADIWKVVFSTAGTLGGCQTVYLDNKGLTCLIVYGE